MKLSAGSQTSRSGAAGKRVAIAAVATLVWFSLLAPKVAWSVSPTIAVSPTSGAPGAGLTVSGAGFPAGDSIFVQIGSTSFDQDVVCVITAAPDGTISGNKASNNCVVPNVPVGSQPLVAIDEQQQGVRATGAKFGVT